MRAIRLLSTATLIGLLCAGCGVRPSGVISGDEAPAGPANGVLLFLVASGRLTPTLRPTTGDLTPMATLALLFAGPDDNEHAAGLSSDLPPNIQFVHFGTVDYTATLTIATDPTTLSTMATNQLVCTTQAILDTGVSGDPLDDTTVVLVGLGHTVGPKSCPIPL